MTKRGKIISGVLGVVALAGAGGVGLASSRDKGVEVRTETITTRDLVSVVTASGVIQPKRKVDISADISGRVIQVAVIEGQTVNRGDLLIRIDPTQFEALVRRSEAAVAQARAQAAQARANLAQAENAARRAEQLSAGDRLISNQELEQARTHLRVAQAQDEAARFGVSQTEASLSEARETLRKTTIVSPMAGRVTRLNIDEGETAVVGTMNNAGSLLLTVADLSVMEASVKVDETDVPRISHGDSATLKIDAFPNQVFTGRVTRISNSAIQGPMGGNTSTQQAVDFEVIITLNVPPAELRPDLSATADIVTDARNRVTTVPIIAVTVRDPDGKKILGGDEDEDAPPGQEEAKDPEASAAETEGVFVARGGKAEFIPVQVGIAGDRYFEVIEGLQVGDTVVAGPYGAVRDLEDGDPIRTPAAPVAKRRSAVTKGAK
ncbi:MAG: efflux RND transporter periplasmic adaptor subunit [Gemmatimonadetes bacterium]|nr:efflux RND transporter periplasmic adaptor subunit [Gemmatimonadota bacterium]